MILLKKLKRYFFSYLTVAIFFHAAIFLIFAVHFFKNSDKTILPMVLQTSLFSFPGSSSTTEKNNLSPPFQKTILSQKKVEHLSSQKIATQNEQNKNIKNQDAPLLKILHKAIAEKQIYPEDAIALHQTGIVTVGFFLHPDGSLTDVSLMKSSGYEDLDKAALDAARSVSIVNDAHLYLKQTEFFSVDVNYIR